MNMIYELRIMICAFWTGRKPLCKSLILNLKSSRGFTLIELLASMVAFVVVGGMVTTIIITTLRTSNKSDTVNIVESNGNYALSQMAKTIRNARVVESPFPCLSPTPVSTITIKTIEGDTVTFTCTNPPSPTPATIASNGASLLDTSAVSLQSSSCQFLCTQTTATNLPIINIQFSLFQKTSSSFSDQIASLSAVSFSTSVVVRNINR